MQISEEAEAVSGVAGGESEWGAIGGEATAVDGEITADQGGKVTGGSLSRQVFAGVQYLTYWIRESMMDRHPEFPGTFTGPGGATHEENQ